MQTLGYYTKNPKEFWTGMIKRTKFLYTDTLYLRLIYFIQLGQVLHLKCPRKFTEKIQWLKLYNHNPDYTKMVDKIEAKKYVSDLISPDIVVPIIKVYDTADQIDFQALPQKFVLKTNHSGGNTGVIVCKDKSKLNKEESVMKLKSSLKESAYEGLLEWPYKNVQRRIFAEEYIEDKSGNLIDYKFMCFNGEPKFIHICPDRNSGGPIHFDYYDLNWEKLPFTIEHPNSNIIVPKPKSFDKMLEYAKILSKNIPLSRIDFYDVDGKPVFGEITFFPYSGLEKFDKEEWNLKLGEWIELPSRKLI